MGHYRIRDLLDRGWYRADIKKFLGEPDQLAKKANGSHVKLYKIEIVHEVENTESFIGRPAAVAPTLFLQGLTLAKIGEVLSLRHNEVLTYTKDVRKAVRQRRLARDPTQRKPREGEGGKTMTHLQKKGVVYFRMAGHSWEETARLLDLPLNIVTNFRRTPFFRKLRRDAILCLDTWFASEETDEKTTET